MLQEEQIWSKGSSLKQFYLILRPLNDEQETILTHTVKPTCLLVA